jgi:predicted dehydrogenase
VLVRFDNGMKGCVTVGQVCAGHKNDLWFEINGAGASLRWFQERQNELWIGHRHAANQVLLKDPALVGPEARRYTHLPPGHQEAWSDAFRNVIADIYAQIAGRSQRTGPTAADARPSFPTFEDGYRAACLVDAILESHRRGGVWTSVHAKSEIST